jgi:glucose-1-phosphatase
MTSSVDQWSGNLRATDVVVFDFAGVIADFVPDRRAARIAELTGLEVDDIEHRLFASGLDARAELGSIAQADVAKVVLAALDHRLSETQLIEAWSRAFSLHPDALDLVEDLPQRTVLFTNNGAMLNHCFAGPLGDVDEVFDLIVCSWELAARKPDPKAFEQMTTKLATSASSIVFFDDSAANVAAGHGAGWRSAVVARAGALGIQVAAGLV